MHLSKRIGTGLAVALVLCAACGGDDSTSTTAAGGSGNGAGASGAGASGGMASSAESASSAAAGGMGGGSGGGGAGAGGAPVTGCANGTVKCPEGTMCCMGVPYPPEGACYKECNLDSDRAIKEAFECVDRDAILEQLASLEISEWSYRRDGTEVRHVGPMAQDFREAFRLGVDAEHIHTVDGQGVTIAAIQALYTRLQELERENAAMAERLAKVERVERGR